MPILRNLGDARIVHHEFERLLASVGAQFVYVLQVDEVLEGRHWNNDGVVEDIATGSGAGCAAAYLAWHKHSPLNHDFILNQGRFVGRPSRISLRVEGDKEPERVIVGGEVSIVGRGKLNTLPEKTLS